MSDFLPRTSVVIPCRNERHHIAACLESLLNQDVPEGDFEVLVADGMSDDGTREVLAELAEKHPRLRILDNTKRLTAPAMNLGIQNARGSIIAIMGAHNRYAQDYLLRSVQELERTGADNVGGAMECEATSSLQKAIAAAHHSPFSVGGARWHNPQYEGPADTVFGGVYRREVFEKIGLFDEELVRNQDDELNLRLTRAGGKIWQSPKIRSWYSPRGSLAGLWRQYMQYGYWKVRVIQKHKIPASLRHLVPVTFLVLLGGLPIVSLFWQPAAWAWLGLVAAYVGCNFLASGITAMHSDLSLLPLFPVVFACYHFGYGYGFLRGILDFIVLQRGAQRSFTRLTRETKPQASAHGNT